MHHFLVPLTLNSDQSALIAKIKGNGGEAIQTSGGLCVKYPKGRGELEELTGVPVTELKGEVLSEASTDIKAFAET